MSDSTRVTELPRMLESGQRLDQPTFHALYQSMAPGTRAELIDGVVHMPSPVGVEHGLAHAAVVMWLGNYRELTPGVQVLDNTTTILSLKSEPQPDAFLRIIPECGGLTRDENGFVHGPPELVVEVAKATRYVDLGAKLADYEQAGVREYVVRAIDPDEIFWFAMEQGTLVRRPVGDDGLYRSTVFRGLWLYPQALILGDTLSQRRVVDLGCATPEHAEFVGALARARGTV